VHWCRFIIKQTFESLSPKKTFTPYVPHDSKGGGHSRAHSDLHDSKGGGHSRAHSDLHGPQTIQYGWEWHKMWFFTRWESSGARTFVCFNLPPRTSDYIQRELVRLSAHHLQRQDSPYSVVAIAVAGIARAYNESVWSIRDLICQHEAVGGLSDPSHLLPGLTVADESSQC
jgi:hypothetical protein